MRGPSWMALLGHGCRAEQRVLVVGVAACGTERRRSGPVWPRPAELVAAGFRTLGGANGCASGSLSGGIRRQARPASSRESSARAIGQWDKVQPSGVCERTSLAHRTGNGGCSMAPSLFVWRTPATSAYAQFTAGRPCPISHLFARLKCWQPTNGPDSCQAPLGDGCDERSTKCLPLLTIHGSSARASFPQSIKTIPVFFSDIFVSTQPVKLSHSMGVSCPTVSRELSNRTPCCAHLAKLPFSCRTVM